MKKVKLIGFDCHGCKYSEGVQVVPVARGQVFRDNGVRFELVEKSDGYVHYWWKKAENRKRGYVVI